MNGVRSTYMRKGYMLTALAAAVLLAASSGTAYAQRVNIGFVGTSGEISEKAHLNANALEDPQMITVRVSGLLAGSRRTGDIDRSLGVVSITPNKSVYIARVTATGAFDPATPALITGGVAYELGVNAAADADPNTRFFDHSDEVMLVVSQSESGSGDTNWVDEKIELKLAVASGAPGAAPASVSPDVYTLTVMESHVAPVAKFGQPDFTLSEQSIRTVSLNVASGIRGVPLPDGALVADRGMISVRVSNHNLVMFGVEDTCPARDHSDYNKKLFRIDVSEGWSAETGGVFTNTALLQTTGDISALAAAGTTADFVIEGCGDGAGIRDPYIVLTILETNLDAPSSTFRAIGDISVGPPLMISIDSDEAVPTLSFSPTDVEIDEGGSTSTVLLAEGRNADDVGMVKLSVEGDAMVSLMQDGEMLEEMGGYVYVDLDGNSSARLEAMSHSDPDLMDGDMAFKAWKLMEGGTDGAMIGEGYWFKVDVRGSTAVPALPLVGQLLLALFLMAGGARLYRRRQG